MPKVASEFVGGRQGHGLRALRRSSSLPTPIEANERVIDLDAGRTRRRNWRSWGPLGLSMFALVVGLLDFALIVGAIPLPVPGLRPVDAAPTTDRATDSFESGTGGWLGRGAAGRTTASDAHVFAGRLALEVQITALTAANKAFIYTTVTPGAQPNSRIVAHLYVPVGAPQLVGTIYVLGQSWAWSSGTFPVLMAGQWNTLTYQIPANVQAPVRELGLMILGSSNTPPYSGTLYLDSVDIQHP